MEMVHLIVYPFTVYQPPHTHLLSLQSSQIFLLPWTGNIFLLLLFWNIFLPVLITGWQGDNAGSSQLSLINMFWWWWIHRNTFWRWTRLPRIRLFQGIFWTCLNFFVWIISFLILQQGNAVALIQFLEQLNFEFSNFQRFNQFNGFKIVLVKLIPKCLWCH